MEVMGDTATVRIHEGLPSDVQDSLRPLFDAEYSKAFGPWDPSGPYGYSPLDVHVVAAVGGSIVGHVGFQRRTITVGGRAVLVGGTGGVLIAPEHRGTGLGRRLLDRARDAMRDAPSVDFGYLGCREEVVGFYVASGWVRIRVDEHSVPRAQHVSRLHPAGPPILIRSASRPVEEWPDGSVDLRGRAW